MRQYHRYTLIIVIALALIFTFGTWQLVQQHFRTSATYPECSSFRADPQGLKGLYDSLRTFDQLEVRRNLDPYYLGENAKDTTMILAALSPEQFQHVRREEVVALQSFVRRGNRLLIAFQVPRHEQSVVSWNINSKKSETGGSNKGDESGKESINPETLPDGEHEAGDKTHKERVNKNPPPQDNNAPSSESEGESSGKGQSSENHHGERDAGDNKSNKDSEGSIKGMFHYARYTSFSHFWHVAVKLIPNRKVKEMGDLKVRLKDKTLASVLPRELEWTPRRYFHLQDHSWKEIYSLGDYPVIIYRTLGQGTIVLMADAGLMKNRTLKGKPHVALLLWLLGRHRQIVFDETHLGLTSQPGVMKLIQTLDLTPLLFFLGSIVLVFLWGTAFPFIPIHEQNEQGGQNNEITVSGKSTNQGLVNFMESHINLSHLVERMLKEWEKSAPDLLRISKQEIEAADIERLMERVKKARHEDEMLKAVEDVRARLHPSDERFLSARSARRKTM